MDPQSTPADHDAADAARRREDEAARSQILRELFHLSAGLARLLSQQVAEQLATVARGEAKAGALPDLSIRYDRLTRSIERTLFMAKKLAEPAALPRPAGAAPHPAPPAAPARPATAAAQPVHQPPAPASPAPASPVPASQEPRNRVLHRDDRHGPAASGAPDPILKLADLPAQFARDVASRRAATLPFPPVTFQKPSGPAGIRPPRAGTDPP